MIGNRSLSLNRSSLVIVGLAALLGLTALIAVSLNGQTVPAASPAGFPAAGDLTGLRSVEAYAARWAGLAEEYAPVQAYAARWAGLAEAYAPIEAYAGRWEGLAGAYRQRAIDAYAARWAGLAETYAGK